MNSSTPTPRQIAYQLRRQRIEMARLFRACFGEKPITVSQAEAIRRIRQRRKRGSVDAEQVLAIGLTLGYVRQEATGDLLINTLTSYLPYI